MYSSCARFKGTCDWALDLSVADPAPYVQGDIETVAAMSPKELTAMIEHISGSQFPAAHYDLCVQGDIETVAAMSPKELTAMLEIISGSDAHKYARCMDGTVREPRGLALQRKWQA